MSTARTESWKSGLWIWVSATLGVIGLLLCVLVGYTVTQVSTLVASQARSDLSFAFSGMTLLILTLLRLLAILVGAGMVFGGLAVSFYTHEHATQLAADATSSVKASLATSSPGIAAIVVGAVVIIAALYSKGEYTYDPPIYQIVSQKDMAARPGNESKAASAPDPAPAASRPFRTASQIFEETRRSNP